MAKFYVQSGTLRCVIDAEDSQRAALWVVHRAMQQVVPLYDDEELSAQQKSDMAAVEGMLVLDHTIYINEQGFDRTDGTTMETFEIVTHWHQLMMALAKLESLLE